MRIEQKLPSPTTPPDTPPTPTQVTLTKAPTPWLQNKNKPQEELPEWAKRGTTNGSTTTYSPTESPVNIQTFYVPQITPPTTPQNYQPPMPTKPAQVRVQQMKPVASPAERVIPLTVSLSSLIIIILFLLFYPTLLFV